MKGNSALERYLIWPVAAFLVIGTVCWLVSAVSLYRVRSLAVAM